MMNPKTILLYTGFLLFFVPNFSYSQSVAINNIDCSKQLINTITKAREYNNNNQLEAAINILNKVLPPTTARCTADSLTALAHHLLGRLYYYNYQDELAIAQWQKAIDIRLALYPNGHRDIVRSYTNIGHALLINRKLEQARTVYQKSLALADQVVEIDTLTLLGIHDNLVYILAQQGDFYAATIQFEEAIALHKRLGIDGYDLIELYESVIGLFEKQQQADSMKKYTYKILAIPDLSEVDFINAYTNLGIANYYADSIQLSADFDKKAIQLLKTQEEKQHLPYNNLSITYRHLNKQHLAIKMAEKAIQIAIDNEDLMGQAESFNTKAMAVLMTDAIAANQLINKALTCFKDTLHISDKPLYVTVLKDKMKILTQIAEEKKDPLFLDKAINIAHKIATVIDNIRQDYQSDISKIFLSKESKTFFETAIQLNWERYQTTQQQKYAWNAFEMAERSKSIILLDAVLAAKAKNQQTDLDTLFDKEASIKRQITDIEVAKEGLSQGNTKEDSTLTSLLATLYNELDQQKIAIKAKDPVFYTSIYERKGYRSIEDLKFQINGSLIEYFVGDAALYAFIISKKDKALHFTKLPISPQNLQQTVQELRESITQSVMSEEATERMNYANQFVDHAQELYLGLIEPIENMVSLDSQLILIPDGILGYLPFEVLLYKVPTKTGDWHTHSYLINKYQISYNYSVALLKEMQQKELQPTKEKFLGLAPSFINRSATWLQPLTNNGVEVQAIQKMIGGTILTKEAATKSTFTTMAADFSILHLATHGKANNLQGDYSCLAFSKDNTTSSLLYNRELYDLKLNAEMVVLSACETGVGELQKGEGIISLARGFSYAGAKSIITTLWLINDSRNKKLMEGFYQHLKNGLTKDRALRLAKIELRHGNNAHPYYWAGVIPIGDNQAIAFKDNRSFIWKLLGFLLISTFLGLFFRRSK